MADELVLRAELPELHCIMPMANVPSVCEHGILSHALTNTMTKGAHVSVADQNVQDLRATKRVPGGRTLHEYANLYINARNPMMFKLVARGLRGSLCVLRVSTDVLDLPDVVVSDANAAAKGVYTRFEEAPEGLAIVNRNLTFARYWTHADYIEELRHKSAMNAEVLVPERVHPRYIRGAWVADAAAKARFDDLGTPLQASINGYLFFM